MTTQTVVCVRGVAGAGKSALRCMLENDRRHLVDVPDLWAAVEAGFAKLPVERITQAVQTGEDIAAVVADAIGDAPALLVNPCIWEGPFLDAVLPRYRVQYW